MRVTASLIVKDEERFLGGCLDSVAGHVDEVVVVDTGSTDASIEIAKAHGAIVVEHRWADDFSAARNRGIDAATGEWILYIDADERLSLPVGGRLLDELRKDDAVGALVRFFPTLNSTPYREYRLFRNDPRIRFSGAMHETLVPALTAICRTDGKGIIESDATLTHLGYEGDLSHKFRRNLPWLRTAIAREPGRLYYWLDLARSLAGLGDGEEALDIARSGFVRAISTEDPRERAVGSALANTLASLLRDRGEDALPVIDKGLELRPGNPGLMLLKASVLLERGALEQAGELLGTLCSVDVDAFIDTTLSFDRRLFTLTAPHLLGVTLLRQGRIAEAAAAFARVSTRVPADRDYAANAAALVGASNGG